VKRPGGDAPFAGWGKCSQRVNTCNGEHLASVKRVLGKIAQAVTHSTLQYVSSVAFEQATPLYGKESPTLESPFLRANSTSIDHKNVKEVYEDFPDSHVIPLSSPNISLHSFYTFLQVST
jgi:hypothetical protein